jgi:hypothetical protein
VIGPVGVGVEVDNVVDEVGKVVGVIDDAGVCISHKHHVVVTQNDPRTFWSWDQNQNNIPFPTHPYTPRFDAE